MMSAALQQVLEQKWSSVVVLLAQGQSGGHEISKAVRVSADAW